MAISKNIVQKLMELQVGDQGRLIHIKESMDENKTLYNSDKTYLNHLVSKYLDLDALEKNQRLEARDFFDGKIPKNISDSAKSIVSSFFNMQSTSYTNLAFFLARFGLAFVFAWSGYMKILNPEPLALVLSQTFGVTTGFALNVTAGVGTVEAAAGVLLLLGFMTRLVTFSQIMLLISGGIVFGMDFVNGPTLWKDVGLLGLAIMILTLGSGKWSLDYLISKKLS